VQASGRRDDSLTRAAVVTAAINVADRDGLEAVTFRRLAADLGVTPMALYKHVRDKRELLAAVRERMLGEIELPPLGDGSRWMQEMREILLLMVVVLRRHPTIAPLAFEGLLDGEAGLELCERLLTLLTQAGFAPEQAIRLPPFISSSLVGLVAMQPADTAPVTGGQFADRARGDLRHLVLLDRARFPILSQLAGTVTAFPDPAYDEQCIELLVLGIRELASS
jgi:TetR/AcrR family transcriptional regulator, tetracycline repressor protein